MRPPRLPLVVAVALLTVTLLSGTAPAMAVQRFGPAVKVADFTCPTPFNTLDAVARDGVLRGFFARESDCGDGRIRYFERRGSGAVTVVGTPYAGHVIAVAADETGTYLLYQPIIGYMFGYPTYEGLRLAKRSRLGGFTPGEQLAAVGGYSGDLVASGGKWWAVWQSGSSRGKPLYQSKSIGTRVTAQPITQPGAGWDSEPSLALLPGGRAVLGFNRAFGDGGHGTRLATATSAARWTDRFLSFGHGGPQVAVGTNGVVYAVWGANGLLHVADNAGGRLREKVSFPGQPAYDGPSLAASGSRVTVGWVTGSDGDVKIAERSTTGRWTSVRLGSRSVIARAVVASTRGKAAVVSIGGSQSWSGTQLWTRTQP